MRITQSKYAPSKAPHPFVTKPYAGLSNERTLVSGAAAYMSPAHVQRRSVLRN